MALALEHLKKPVGELLMHIGETYRRIQEERELLDRVLPTQHDGKVRTAPQGRCEEQVRAQARLPQFAQLGTEQIYLLPPQRPLLSHIIGPIIGRSGTGQLSNSSCSGHWWRTEEKDSIGTELLE